MSIDCNRRSGFQGAFIDGKLQGFGGILGCDRGDVGGLEPAIFLDLVIGHGGQWWFGAHDNDCLEFAFDFSGFAPDKKFTDIKFRHVAAFPWKYYGVSNAARPGDAVRLVGQYGSSCLPAAELSRRHDETSIGLKVAGVNYATQGSGRGRRLRYGRRGNLLHGPLRFP